MISHAICCKKSTCNFVVLKKIYTCFLTSNCTRNHIITYTYPSIISKIVMRTLKLVILIKNQILETDLRDV